MQVPQTLIRNRLILGIQFNPQEAEVLTNDLSSSGSDTDDSSPAKETILQHKFLGGGTMVR